MSNNTISIFSKENKTEEIAPIPEEKQTPSTAFSKDANFFRGVYRGVTPPCINITSFF